MNLSAAKWTRNSLILFVLLVISITLMGYAIAAPSGPIITSNSTINYTPQAATQITTPGGSFTTLVLNATTQTPRWKAYIGNVTGRLALDDSSQKSIFDWSLASVTGEVYATRNNSLDWSGVTCADEGAIFDEEFTLNMSSSNPDTINKTFSYTIHRSFYVGTLFIENSTCRSLATYINDTAQIIDENAKFQEMVLKDSYDSIVYATLIDQNTTGFNSNKYDFQMIVPENEFRSSPSTYFLYVELI